MWSRLAHATLTLEPLRLDLLVEVLLHDNEPLESDPVVARGDARLLDVAARNLIENARVHGGGVVKVVVVQRGDEAPLEVHDAGPGITDPALLQPFAKGPGSPGSGLCLALVQRIAQKHGGAWRPVPW